MSKTRRRLPLRLKPPGGRHFRLQWRTEDLSLVLRGEPLCEAFGEGDPEPVRLSSPATGRLYQLVPDSERVAPEAILGELECGGEWDRGIRHEAGRAQAELRIRLFALGHDSWRKALQRNYDAVLRGAYLQGDVFDFENRASGQYGPPLALKPTRPARAAAALLEALQLLRKQPPVILLGSLSPSARQQLAAVAARLGAKLGIILVSALPAPRAPRAAVRHIEALDTLERLYDACIADCRKRISGFPLELQQDKLALWQDFKQDQLRRLQREDG